MSAWLPQYHVGMGDGKGGTITGKVEQGFCRVEVAIGPMTPTGCRVHLPPKRAALDTIGRGPTVSPLFANELGLEPDEHGLCGICYTVYNGREMLWNGETQARIANIPMDLLFGMGEILQWNLTINGPEGTFTLEIPSQV